MEEWYKMRLIQHDYDEREETDIKFSPANADIVTDEVGEEILSSLGEGESILEDKDGVITRYSKLNGKLFKENTTLTEV